MSRIQYKITYYSHGTETRLGDMEEPAMVHLEDITEPAIEKIKQVSGQVNQLDLQDNTYISVHDLNRGTPQYRGVHAYIGHFARQRIGDYEDIDCTRRIFDIDLLIDGKAYDYSYIMEHFMEVKALIEDIRTEKVLNEL